MNEQATEFVQVFTTLGPWSVAFIFGFGMLTFWRKWQEAEERYVALLERLADLEVVAE